MGGNQAHVHGRTALHAHATLEQLRQTPCQLAVLQLLCAEYAATGNAAMATLKKVPGHIDVQHFTFHIIAVEGYRYIEPTRSKEEAF